MTTCSAIATFWCMLTEPAGALMSAPIRSPTVTGMSHQPSAQARTPRVAHWSANSFMRS
jgi:hypothetical protein